MEAGIVGLPNVGKSTLFNALTAAGIASENYPFCTIEPNVGAVAVPDERLARLNKHVPTEKIVPAMLKLVDIAGIVRGASEGEGLGNQFLSHIRTVDAILHVVRCFDEPDVVHVEGSVDPIRDVETIDTELMLADLQSVESQLDRAQRTARTGDKDAKTKVEVLQECQQILAAGKPVRGVKYADEKRAKMLAELQLLTSKPVLYVANVNEDDLAGEGAAGVAPARAARRRKGATLCPCARDWSRSWASLRETSGRRCSRAWDCPSRRWRCSHARRTSFSGCKASSPPVRRRFEPGRFPRARTAPQAAGVIHTDFERGFIRCETYSVDDLDHYKTEKAIREAGKLRVEGKSYVMQDSDVCHFLFNV